MKNKIFIFLLIFIIYSCKTTEHPIIIEEPVEQEVEKEEIVEIIPEIKEPTEEELLNQIIDNMTLEEKVGQVFIFQIRRDKNGNNLYDFNSDVEELISDFNPGGIILFSENVKNNNQVQNLIFDLQLISKTPLFIGVDEEGGIVSRLGKEKNVDVTHLPPALSIGSKNDPNLAYLSGKILGRELAALGFNMDMAPIADVNTNPDNPVIGNRTYSSDPHIAADMVESVVKGLQEHNVVSVLKHFPGHGDTSHDTHFGSVVSPHNIDRLNQIEFVPFIRGIESGVDGIMSAHIIMPGISSSPLPATLNYDIMTGIIRDQLNFDGIIITDALDMGAISLNYSSADAAILAFKAGVDILLMPLDQKSAYNALLESVKNGLITEKRLDESVFRILKVKNQRKILNRLTKIETIDDVKNDPDHIKIVEAVLN